LGYAAGGDDFLIKSSTAEELKAKIKRFTSISNHQKDLAKSVDSAHMLNQLLEERVKRRTDKIVEQKDKLESAYQELKMAQKQLVHSEKMASIGQLAAGVAHEINNPVAFVKSNLCSLNNYVKTYQKLIHIQQNALEELTEEIDAKNSHLIGELQTFCNDNDIDFINEDIHTLLEEAIDGTSRVEEITKSLKIYSRASDDNMEEFDINCCITDTIKMLNSQLKYSCDVNTTLGQLPMYHGNRSKISQVFTNIIVNAAQAMETKGSLSIHTISDSAAIKIIFADTGKGIAEENLQKLFDPFFTTKPVGEGTGLGLSISHGIIKDHGGDIDVCSEIGKGTTFTILLPMESHTVH
jgi:C4-dicarboxylate-specific signal transduction histidine kinase